MRNNPRPPALAERLLRAITSRQDYPHIAGDLEEEFVEWAVPTLGPRAARGWYWRQVLRAVRPVDVLSRIIATLDVRHAAQVIRGFGGDLRIARRMLFARPAFSFVIVLTLAIAIGANTALFGAVQAVLLRPLPLRDVERVVLVEEHAASVETGFVSPITFEDWTLHADVFDSLAAVRFWQTVNLEDQLTDPQPVDLVTASANYFEVLGITPLLGRTYREEQHERGGSEAVISHRLWRDRYRSDPNILGRVIQIRGTPANIVGVMPPVGLTLDLGWGDVWTCLYRYDVQQRRAQGYSARYFTVFGRLHSDVSMLQARERMAALQRRLWLEPGSVAAGYDVRLTPVTNALTAPVSLGLSMSLAAVLLVLLIACANVANLMLVRASARTRETAVRLALGATRGQLVRLQLAESVVLVAAGMIGGLAIAHGLLISLQQLRPDLPRIDQAALTPAVLVFTVAVSIACVLIVSVAPAMFTRADRLRDRLTDGGRGGTEAGGASHARHLLVVTQMALAFVLLAAGGLLIRSLHNVLQVDPGFRSAGVVMFDTYLPTSRYPDRTAYTKFSRDLLRELKDLAGVRDAGGLLYFPYRPKLWPTALWVEGHSVPEGQEPVVYYNLIAGDYFSAMGMPIVEGRLPTVEEMWDRPGVVVINRALAREHFHDGRAIGRRLRTDKDGLWLEVIGVVGDVRQKGLQEHARPEVYLPFSSMPMPFLTWVVHGERSPEELLGTIRGAVARVDAGLAVANLAPLHQHVSAHTANRRFALLLLGAFAGVALALGAIGIYSVLSYTVGQRRREWAIRLAVGATPRSVRAMVMRSGIRVAALGTFAGLVGALFAGRLMRALLFGVASFDPAIFILVSAVVMAAAVIASWVPAWRAARTDGVEALRGTD